MPPMPGFQTHAGADRATTEFHSNGEQFSLLSTILFFLLKCSQSLWLVFRLRQVRLQVDKFSFQESRCRSAPPREALHGRFFKVK